MSDHCVHCEKPGHRDAGAPCSVERTTRQVIEHKLLTSLEDDADKVAILATKRDLDTLITALRGFTWGDELASGLEQLRAEAFPPNDALCDGGPQSVESK